MNVSLNKPNTGIVYIVGAGPGDRKLITLKGVECLQRADVVIYDLLLNDALLEHCPAHTEKIQAPDPRIRTTRQDELNYLLIEHAKAGKIVVRLKGGDPYIFGRGGEEAVALTEAGIPFEVVPGITSAIAASAYAGIPVTHRDYASSVAFVTGHSAALHPDSNINWAQLATAVDTLVVYMGVAHLRQIVERLTAHGRDPQTPCQFSPCRNDPATACRSRHAHRYCAKSRGDSTQKSRDYRCRSGESATRATPMV